MPENAEERLPFAPGDPVAWSHERATEHAPESVVRRSAAESWPHVLFGEVVEAANEARTWWVVKFGKDELSKTVKAIHPDDQDKPDGEEVRWVDVEHSGVSRFKTASATHPDKDCLTLTSDELVRVAREN